MHISEGRGVYLFMAPDLLWPVGKFCNINTTQFTPLHCRDMQVCLEHCIAEELKTLQVEETDEGFKPTPSTTGVTDGCFQDVND